MSFQRKFWFLVFQLLFVRGALKKISYTMTMQTLEEQMPDVYKQLLDIRDCVEKYYRDVCDIEFTIQKGQVFILQVHKAKRTGRANLRFLLQFLEEGKIGLAEVLTRINLTDIEEFIVPVIYNPSLLTPLGKGLPASAGAAAGEIALQRDEALRFTSEGRPFLYVREEICPEDIDVVCTAQGVLTTRGAMTSHAALMCRGWGKPCVSGYSQIQLNIHKNIVTIFGYGEIKSGKWLTINGNTGEVFAGNGEVSNSRWQDQLELSTLAQIIELVIIGEDIPLERVGLIWKIRDLFVHNIPLQRAKTSKKAIHARNYISFEPPKPNFLADKRNQLACIDPEERENCSFILLSLSDTLSRLLSSALGIGNHYLYFRPLWDPQSTISFENNIRGDQMIGFEYFDINRHIPHLVDVASITFVLCVKLRDKKDEWFLDLTNRMGESLVVGSDLVQAYDLRLNNAHVSHVDLPLLYHTLRRREYYWRFYEANDTSHDEIVEFLSSWPNINSQNRRLISICTELGLLRTQELTLSGKSLIGESPRKY